VGRFSLQHGHLLEKSEEFDSDVSAAPEEDAGSGNQGETNGSADYSF